MGKVSFHFFFQREGFFALFMVITLLTVFFRDIYYGDKELEAIQVPHFIANLRQELKQQTASLKNREFILALAVGERNFSYSFKQKMIATGTIHLIAVSAFHSGIMILLLNLVLKFFFLFIPLRHRKKTILFFIFKLAASFFYFFITGASIPTLRALTFILFFDFFLISGNYTHSLFTFFYSLAAVSLLIPKSALSLSFLMSAICIATLLNVWRQFPKSAIISLILVSVVLNYALIPVFSTLSGNISFSVPFVNLFVIPLVSFAIPFITLAQFLIFFSSFLSFSFLKAADFIVSPAIFLISFFSDYAKATLIPLLDPHFFIKIVFISSFFCSFYLRAKSKLIAVAVNLCCLTFFFFSFPCERGHLLRPTSFQGKLFCVRETSYSGRIFLDGYRFNPKVNDYFLTKLERAAAECGIRKVLSFHTPQEMAQETLVKLRQSKRFKSTKFYFLSQETFDEF